MDAIFALFNTAWAGDTTAIVGSVPDIRWAGVEEPDKPPMNAFWCRVSTITTTPEKQTALRIGVAPSQNRRYTSSGIVFVQIFCPMSVADAMNKGRKLAELARNAFRGKETANNVWFRDMRIDPLAPEDEFYRFNVSVEYEFDEIG
jgi:hypothetical protein